jgi:hypothetical protein
MRAGGGLSIAVWIALIALVPLAAIFVVSLVAAVLIGAAVLAVYFLLRSGKARPLPRQSRSRADEIELDPRDYRRIPSDPPTER